MSNWNSFKLTDLCNVEYGTRVVRKRDGGTIFPVYGGGGATFSMDINNRENRMVVARFAMSKKCTRFVKGKFFLNDSGLTISAKDENLIDEQFLNYQILSLNDTIYSLARGTAQKNLNVDEFKKLILSFPDSIEEQKEIVEILDQIFKSIHKAKNNIEKNIDNAKELFQSKLNQIFSQAGEGWKEHTLNDLCEKITQGPNPKFRNDIPSENNFILKTKDFYNNKVYYEKCNKISDSLIKEWERFVLKEDDFIICLVGVGSIGKSNLFKNQMGKKFIFTRATGLIRTKKELLTPQFLRFFFLSGLGINMINKGIGGTTGQLVIKTSYFKSLEVNIPKNVEVQNKIVEEIKIFNNHIQSVLLVYNEELNNLDELKNSILQKAFTAELTNKDKVA